MFGVKQGWIGVDLGAGAVKIARLARHGKRFELIDAAIVAHHDNRNGDSGKPHSFSSEILTGLSLAQRTHGRRTAAVLSMTECEFHAIHIEQRNPTTETVRKELQKSVSHRWQERTFDAWPISLSAEGNSQHVPNLGVISTSADSSNDVATAMAGAKLDCRAIDAGPTALARAVQLMVGRRDVPLATIDWGYGGATFCAVRNGTPLYVRSLKQCAFSQVISQLCDSMACSPGEAARLLQEVELASTKEDKQAFSHPVLAAIRPHLEQLIKEVRRTLQYLATHRRSLSPTGVVLLGAGATVHGVASQLTNGLELEARTWQPNAEILSVPAELNAPISLLAPAISASMLSWERA